MIESFLSTAAQQSDAASSVLADLSSGSDTLLIAFGGITGDFQIPPFEFLNITQDLGVKRIYLRDFDQIWYHHGLRGIAGGIDELTVYLLEQIESLQAKRVVLVGHSMGGYAAILFGQLLGADEVRAFSPKTVIAPHARLLCGDIRRWDRIWALHRSRIARRDYFDLRRVPALTDATTFHLHYNSTNFFDRLHAARLASLPRFVLHPHAAGARHGVVRYLRSTGSLKEILGDAVRL